MDWLETPLRCSVLLLSLALLLQVAQFQITIPRVTAMSQSGFKHLATNMVGPTALPGSWGDLAHLNRYSDIIPNPHSRVRLNRVDGDPHSEYINANLVHNFGFSSRAYIAAQGPTQDSRGDFWRMVWERNSTIVVMLTGLMENGVQKCERYWPLDVGAQHEVHYGPFHIEMVSSKRADSYLLNELRIRRVDGDPGSNVTRQLQHFWYDSWPDHGVPIDVSGVTTMLNEVRLHGARASSPWIIHCSAGIGRTGTFIAIDMGMEQLIEAHHTDVLQIIKTMRKDRGGMVQTYAQADFAHRALSSIAQNLSRLPATHQTQEL